MQCASIDPTLSHAKSRDVMRGLAARVASDDFDQLQTLSFGVRTQALCTTRRWIFTLIERMMENSLPTSCSA